MKKLLVCASLITAFVTHANAMITEDGRNESESHCPHKLNFNALMEKKAENIKNNHSFEFELDGNFWKASSFKSFDENGEENSPSTASLLQTIRGSQLVYNTELEDKNWAKAQFISAGRNQLVIRLDRFYPQPTEDGRTVYELHCLNKIQFKNLMQENRDKIATKTLFTFEIDHQKWQASNIQHYDNKSEECSYKEAQLSLSILQSPVTYNADFNDPSWAVAQFPHADSDRNALVIRLDRIN